MAEPQPPRPRSPRRRSSWIRWLAGVVGLVVALVAAANAYVVASTRARIVGSVEEAPARPVAIVLGNRVFPDGRASDGLAERLRVALALYRGGRVQRLFVSGAVHGPEYDEPGVMAAWLMRRGVPAGAITLDRTGHRTAATMAAAAAAGIREALVCTQSYHLPRALYLARRAGIDAVGVPAQHGGSDGTELRFRIFLRESLARFETVIETALRH